jgi:hypothetical protein
VCVFICARIVFNEQRQTKRRLLRFFQRRPNVEHITLLMTPPHAAALIIIRARASNCTCCARCTSLWIKLLTQKVINYNVHACKSPRGISMKPVLAFSEWFFVEVISLIDFLIYRFFQLSRGQGGFNNLCLFRYKMRNRLEKIKFGRMFRNEEETVLVKHC